MTGSGRLAPALREMARWAPVRPSLAAGLRALLALGVPLLLALPLAEPGLIWAAIGGFVGTLVDAGGGYRARAANLAAVGLGGAAAGTVAALLGHSLPLAVLGMLLWGTAGASLRVYGAVGASTGLTSSATFAVSLSLPASGAEALARGGWLLLGGAWAAAVVLAVWPLRPHLPGQRAVGAAYRALARYAAEVARLAERGTGEHGSAGRRFDAVRQALEAGWSALEPRWADRGGRGLATDRLLVLLETADQLLGALFPLADVVERLPDGPARAALAEAVRELAGFAGALARAVERDGVAPPAAPRWPRLAPDAGAGEEERATLRHAQQLMDTLGEFTRGASEVVAGAARAPGSVPRPTPDRARWVDPIRANLSSDSLLLRHALRVGVTTALGVATSELLGLEHGHWVTLTVVFILQPHTGLTLIKGMQRVAGTVAGGAIAALTPMLVTEPAPLLAVVALLGAATVVAFRVNYALFALFVTPTFVLLAELQTGEWNLVGARIVDTLIGGALAMGGARLLWRMPERRQFPAHAADALLAARAYLAAVAEPRSEGHALAAARRELGLAIINAGESYERLLIEEGGAGRATEAARTLLLWLRRLASAAVALGTAVPTTAPEAGRVRRFAAEAGAALAGIAEAVAGQAPPPPLPPLPDPSEYPPHLRPQLERIDRPIRVLHRAATRSALSARPAGAYPSRP